MKGRERSMAIKSGINKQGWEKSDFPVACEKCYGQNPYVRMLKQDFGQQCRICFRPFTVFKWKGDRGIYKRTCVCQSCSKQKNICQVCTLDLQFGLPMEVRDRRCGKNGKYLLDENFSNADSMKIKPPPPAGPPPKKHSNSEKELVYIPEKDSDEEGEGAKGVNKQNEKQQQQQQYIKQQKQSKQQPEKMERDERAEKGQKSENEQKQKQQVI